MKSEAEEIRSLIKSAASRGLNCKLSAQMFEIAFPTVERTDPIEAFSVFAGPTLNPSARERAESFARELGLTYHFEASLNEHYFLTAADGAFAA